MSIEDAPRPVYWKEEVFKLIRKRKQQVESAIRDINAVNVKTLRDARIKRLEFNSSAGDAIKQYHAKIVSEVSNLNWFRRRRLLKELGMTMAQFIETPVVYINDKGIFNSHEICIVLRKYDILASASHFVKWHDNCNIFTYNRKLACISWNGITMSASEFLESVEDELVCVTEGKLDDKGKLDDNRIHDMMKIIGCVHTNIVVERVEFVPRED